ncbi:hypothetical protein N1851_007104 [Merluccius polli]|uniref:Uncharacterized protein n=1 Tax=Merluccius polli TaxID=89951 RepID=A0AA47N4B0_MERPO|nr:hypothetical protein N1851_007104 [Merluccius polli]
MPTVKSIKHDWLFGKRSNGDVPQARRYQPWLIPISFLENRLYVSAIVDIIEFLVSNELPLRGAIDTVDKIGEVFSGLFLVAGTKDPTGTETVSTVVRYVDQNCTVQERLLLMQTTNKCDALSLINLVLEELSNVGLEANKILSQCYDAASMSRRQYAETYSK